MIQLLTIAIVLLFLSIFLSAIYTYCLERFKRQPPIILFCSCIVLFLAGTTILFIATSWKWGLAGLGIYWLVVLGVNLGITTVFRTREYVNPLSYKRVNEVTNLEKQHNAELEAFWYSTSPDECASLMINFLDELRHKYPREYSQLNPERLPVAISESLRNSIKRAYTTGHMISKGWISQKHLADFNLYLGDKMASDLRLAFNGSKSNGTAFAIGYTAVAARGHLKVLKRASV